MKTETRLALTIFLCAALIAGAFTVRDSGITGLATEGTANLAPEYSTTSLSTPSGTALTVDLAKYFSDPDGDALTFLATDEDMVSVSIDGSIATFVPAPGFAGERVITVVASDGANVVRAPVKLVIGSATAPEEPAALPEETVVLAEAPVEEAALAEETPLATTGTMDAGTQDDLEIMDVADNCEPGPVLINTSTTLTQNIASNNTCLHINSDNLVIDCAGFSIGYNLDGGDQEYGVLAKNHTNITIQDCVIIDLNSSGNHNIGINFTDVNGSIINNNTISINGTSNNDGIYLTSTSSSYPSNNNTITNNTINSTSGSSNNYGIMLYNYVIGNNITSNNIMDSVGITGGMFFSTGSSQNNVSNNNISVGAAGRSGIYGISSFQSTNNITANNIIVQCTNACKGIYLFDSHFNIFKANNVSLQYGTYNDMGVSIYDGFVNTIEGNIIATNGTYNNYGIVMQAVSNYNIVDNNTISSTGDEYNNTGILVSVSSIRNNITGNNITTSGSSVSHGIYVEGGSNDNIFISHNISPSGTGSAGICIKFSNGTAFEKTTLTGAQVWINTTQDTRNNFTNTTFATAYGGINIPFLVEINESQEISQDELNVTNNKAFLNSSNLTFLNGTGIITLNGLAITDPKARVDWNDDGAYEDCPANVCTDLGYLGGVFVFNVSHFTGYASAATGITSCPITINQSTTLSQNLVSNTSCITIGNDSIVLDCAGYSIQYNAQGVNNAFGIASNNTGNITIRNCSIIGINNSGNYTAAINLSWVNNSLITNNTIIGNGSDNNFAILMESSPNLLIENNTIRTMPLLENNSVLVMRAGSNSTISNNTIIAGGTYLGHGIIINASHSNRFDLNNITTSASFSYAVKIEGSNHSIFTKTILFNATNWITSSDNTQNNFTNTTFEGDTAAINMPGKFELNGSEDISNQKLNGTGYRAFLNSTNLTYLNTTGIIKIYGITQTNPEPVVDWNDDDSYEAACPTDVCTEISYSGNTYVFNVTHFTKYSALEGAVVGCPVTINESTTLTQNLDSNDSCVTINASNITLDCNGFSISYNANGSNSEFGIIAADLVNITVTNCNIRDINSTGQYDIAINFTNVNDSSIDSNNITANGTFGAQAIVMLGNMTRNVITDNIINTFGTGSTNWGIALLGDIALTNMTGNEIATNGSGLAYGISLDGGSVSETRITGNRVSTQGTGSSCHGIVLSYANSTTIANNNITAGGALLSYGVYVISSFNAVENNTITALSGKNNSGIYVWNGTFNNFTSNTITTNGTTDNFGIILNTSADTNVFRFTNITTNGSGSYCVYVTNSNGTFYNTLLNHTGEWTGDWIYSFKVAGGSNVYSNFTNTTMATNHGSVNFPGVVEISNILDVTRARLDVTANQTYMNTVPLQVLNTTGIITIYNISFTDPKPRVDWNNDGAYDDCPGDVCTELSYTSGVEYVFNVTHFTSYAVAEGFGVITDCPVTINQSTTLTQNLSSEGNCVTFGNDSMYLDCNGYTLAYDTAGGIQMSGVIATNRTNVTVRNCNIWDSNSLGDTGIGINFTNTSNSSILNNNITANGSANIRGISLRADSSRNIVANNTVIAFGSSSNNYGLQMVILSSYNNITGNKFLTNGTQADYGIYVSGSSDSLITENTINASGSSSENYGIYLTALASGTAISKNNITTNGTTENHGILLQWGPVENCTIAGNSILAQGTTTTNYGVAVVSLGVSWEGGNTIANNTIMTLGSSLCHGMELTSAFRHSILNNTIVPGPGVHNRGIDMWSGYYNNFTGNIIITNGTSEAHGIVLNYTGDTNVFNYTNISTNGTGSYGILSSASNATFFNTLLNNTNGWIYSSLDQVASPTTINLTNTTFATGNGSVNIPYTVQVNDTLDVASSGISILSNSAYVATNALQAFNTTGIITLYGITYIDPEPIVDWADTSTYVLCPDSVCTELDYTGGTYVFNVSHFTTYSTKEVDTFNITACPVTVNTSARLAQNITFAGASPSYCVRLNSDDIILDCENNWINRSATGGNTVGIYAINRRNITIKNCRIDHDNDDDVNDFSGINVNRTNSSLILNNTILFTINSSDPSGPDANGIIIEGNDNTITNNTVNASIDSIPGPSYLYGLDILGSRNNATGNAIRTIADNVGASYGRTISLRGDNHTVSNNSFTVLGIATDNYALYANANRSVFVNNTISGNSTYAIRLIGVNNCSFNITTINATRNWISRTGSAENNFTNTTFVTGNGSINVLGTFDGTTTIISDLNITYNTAFVNSSVHSELNKSAIITLYGITYVNPGPRVDWNEDGNYEDCPSDICTELGYSGGVYVFNVSHFTGFSSSETPLSNISNLTLTKMDNPDPVNASSNLTYQINITITGNGTAYNVTLTETYPAEVIYLASQPAPAPPTLYNYTWELGHLTEGTNYSANITVLVLNITNGTVINNTVNVTFQNETSGNQSANVTISTTVLNPALFNLSNISVTKTDSPDSVNVSTNLTYQINVSITGNGTAYNVTVNDTYPNETIYLTSQPSPLSGTNNTWILGNLTQGTNISVNITLLVLNITNGSLINNTVNVTFQNETSGNLSANASASTTVLNPPLYNLSSMSITKTDSPDPVTAGDSLNYTITVNSTGNGTAYNVTVNDTYPAPVVYSTSQPTPLAGTNNTWILGNLTPGTVIVINVTVTVPSSVSEGVVLNNTVNATFNNETSALLSGNASSATTVIVTPPTPGGGSGGGGRIVPRNVVLPELTPSLVCVESWECEDWNRCDEGSQFRTCVDLNNCNKTSNLPQTERKCVPEKAGAEVSAEKSPMPEMPALAPVSVPVSTSGPVAEPVTICSLLPMSIEAALIIAGLLALVSLLAGRESRLKKRWRLPVDALLAACLALSVWHYLSCKELLLVETIALGVLALFVITLKATDFIASRRHPAEGSAAPVIEPEEMPEVPLPEEEIPEPEPEEIPVPEQAEAPEEIPEPEPEEIPEPIVISKPAIEPEMPKVIIPMLEEVVRQKRPKPAEKIIITSPKKQQKQRKKERLKVKVAPPVLEEGMRDWRDVVRRTGKTLRKLDSTLRRLKKKK